MKEYRISVPAMGLILLAPAEQTKTLLSAAAAYLTDGTERQDAVALPVWETIRSALLDVRSLSEKRADAGRKGGRNAQANKQKQANSEQTEVQANKQNSSKIKQNQAKIEQTEVQANKQNSSKIKQNQAKIEQTAPSHAPAYSGDRDASTTGSENNPVVPEDRREIYKEKKEDVCVFAEGEQRGHAPAHTHEAATDIDDLPGFSAPAPIPAPAPVPAPAKPAKIFRPPTVDEVRAYCAERKNGVDAERFVDFYESKGWVVGKAKMKDWKAAVRTWERSDYGSSSPLSPSRDDAHAALRRICPAQGRLGDNATPEGFWRSLGI